MIPNAPPPLSPTPRMQLKPSPVDPQRVIPARVAQLQSDVYALRRSSAARLDPVIGTRLVRRGTVKFMNTEVPRLRGDTCWNQHRQVFDVIVKSNGWDDDSRPTAACSFRGGCVERGLVGAGDTMDWSVP